jgi:hypothetical protein
LKKKIISSFFPVTMAKSKSKAKRDKYTAKQFLSKPQCNKSKGPFQDQSVDPTADKLASKKRAPSSAEDSESDEVDVQTSSDDEAEVAAPPLTKKQLANKGYTEPSSEEDEPIKK